MNIRPNVPSEAPLSISGPARWILLLFAIAAALGPNALYLYALFSDPSLNAAAMDNPVAAAFMIEATMLLLLFLWYVYRSTGSFLQVIVYLALAFLGSLAFSFPLFLYMQSRSDVSGG